MNQQPLSLEDVNVWLGRWPTRRLPHDEPAELVEKLRATGVTRAWAGSFESILHHDVAGVNLRLALECREFGQGLLLPIGAVNPFLDDWAEDIRRCSQELDMSAIRLLPGYHGYALEQPLFGEVLQAATAAGLAVQLVAALEDERTQHPRLSAPAVELEPLIKWLEQIPRARVMVLNGLRLPRRDVVSRLAELGVCFDLAMLEGLGGIESLLTWFPSERLVFGSHFPFYCHESAGGKLAEAELGGAQEQAIRAGNAIRFLR